MITPRATRLVRVTDLQAFRSALAALACEGPPFAARDRLVVVPSVAAGEHLRRTIEWRVLLARGAVVLPDFVPASHLVEALAERLHPVPTVLRDAEREALMRAACREASAAGHEPPFHLRPGIVGEMLRFYDDLHARQRSVDAFERLALGMLEPGAGNDRGAARLVQQTRFLVAAFRVFASRSAEVGVDVHGLAALVVAHASPRPVRHVVVAVGDRAYDSYGLRPVEWDVLARIPGLERLDVVATDRTVAGPFHETIHTLLPGIDEVRFECEERARSPVLLVPPREGLVHRPRDREDEVAGFARRVKAAVRAGRLSAPSRAALVVHQRLPYVYVSREICRSAGVPCQLFDALPLAAEPYAAALDLVMTAVASNFARAAIVALLRSPHLRLAGDAGPSRDADALDRALAERAYLGDPAALARLAQSWQETGEQRLARLAHGVVDFSRALAPLQEPQAVSAHLRVVLACLEDHEGPPPADDAIRDRHLRARGGVRGLLRGLADAYERFDPAPVGFGEVRALVRRWVDAQTFAPRTGEAGVHVIDSASARFGEFDMVQVAGLVDGEWPEPPRRNIFYSAAILRELGWPAEQDRLYGARAAFADLLSLPRETVVVSSFLLEADAPASLSPLVDEVAAAGFDIAEEQEPTGRIFDEEALSTDPVRVDAASDPARGWLALRAEPDGGDVHAYRGFTGAHEPGVISLGAIERYLDCPFKFFASTVLRLEEPPEEGIASSPRVRGRFVHEALQRFFEAWDQSGAGPITPATVAEARRVFADAVAPLLATLSDTDAAIERTRLLGSAIAPGVVELLLTLEAARRPEPVTERWLERRFEGPFVLDGVPPPVHLNGVADRVDLLPGRRLRVVDYKSGSVPQAKAALQPPIYALCAKEALERRDGAPWQVEEASYLGFSGQRSFVPLVRASAKDADERLADAAARVRAVVDGVRAGQFPPRPLDEMSCRYCAYPSVCRKDYVGDE